MPLKLTSKGAVRFSWASDDMEALWALRPEDTEEELLAKMRKIVAFVDAQNGKEPLPERIPGMALGMAQTQYPAPVDPDVPVPYTPVTGNGWAGMPPLPARLEGEVEFIPPEEQ